MADFVWRILYGGFCMADFGGEIIRADSTPYYGRAQGVLAGSILLYTGLRAKACELF